MKSSSSATRPGIAPGLSQSPDRPENHIAYQGEPGANSDAACREMFPELKPLPCPTFEDAFEAVETGLADLAMIPVDNSIAGRVATSTGCCQSRDCTASASISYRSTSS